MSAKTNQDTYRNQIISIAIAHSDNVSIQHNFATSLARCSGIFDIFNVVTAEFTEETDEDGMINQNLNVTITSIYEEQLKIYINQRAILLLNYSDGNSKLIGTKEEIPLLAIKLNTPHLELSIDRRTSIAAIRTYFSPC